MNYFKRLWAGVKESNTVRLALVAILGGALAWLEGKVDGTTALVNTVLQVLNIIQRLVSLKQADTPPEAQ